MMLQIKFNIVLTSKYTSSFTLKALFCCIISKKKNMPVNKFKTLLCVKMIICYDVVFRLKSIEEYLYRKTFFPLRFQNGWNG